MGDVERPRGSLIHELRTPLTQVIGFAELLAEEAGAGPPRDLVPSLRRIAQAGRRLTRLLDEHFGRGETGGPDEVLPLTPAEETRLRAGFERRSRRLREVLGRLVGEEVMAWLLEGAGPVRVLEATLLCAAWCRPDPPGEPAQALEDVNQLGDPLLRAIADARGIVVGLGPEGLSAFFGFPEPRPDDAERAIRAALRLQLLALDRGGALRIGLASGRVAVGLVGNPQRASIGVVGAAVEAAQALCGAASAGRVLATRAAVEAAGPKVVTGEPHGEALNVTGVAGVEGLRLP